MLLPRLRPGDLISATVNSAGYMNRIIAAAEKGARRARAHDGAIQLAPYVYNGTPTTIKAYSLCGARGIDGAAPTTEPEPILQATLGRSNLLYYTGEVDNLGEGYLWAYPIPETPIRLRAKDFTGASGYVRKYVPGMPCGRAINEDTVSPDEGGLILVTKPYRETGSTGDFFCWAMKDTVQIWDAFIIVQSGTPAPTTPTDYLNGRGTYVAGLLTADPSNTPATALTETITKFRCDVHPRDPDETYVDGVHVKIYYSNGEWKVLWSSCEAVTGLTGKQREPA